MNDFRERTSISALKTGWIITTALLILFLVIFFSGNIAAVLSPKVSLYANVGNVMGLRTGAPVWLRGIEVGNVKNQQLENKGSLVRFSVGRRYLRYVTVDAFVRVSTMGLLGDKFLEIEPGDPYSAPVKPGDTLCGESPVDLEKAAKIGAGSLDKMSHLIAAIDSFLVDLRESRGSFTEFVRNPEFYDQSVGALRSLSLTLTSVGNSRGTIHELLQNPVLYNSVNDAALKIERLADQIGYGKGLAGSLLSDSVLVKEVHSTIKSLNDLLVDIRLNPKRYFSIKLL